MEENKSARSVSVIKSAFIVIVFTLVAKVLGFVREICMGSSFGTSIDSDIYFWAMSITTTIFMAIATAVSSAMLPTLNEYRLKDEKDKMKKYIYKIFSLTSLIAIVIIAILIVTAPWFVKLIAVKYTGENLDLAIKLVQILSVSFMVIMMTHVAKTILQANEKFFVYSIISLPYNILIIIYLLFFSNKFGIEGLAYVTVCGWLCQFLIQLPSIKKSDSSLGLNFHFKDEDIKKFLFLLIPLLLSSLVYSINTLVDKSIALSLSDGKVSGLTYGYSTYSAIVTVLVLGISSVLYPKFIESRMKLSKEEFKDEMVEILKIMTYISLPLMICFLTLSKEIIEVAYMRNNFTALSVELSSYALAFYALGTLSYAIQEILLKIFYSLKESKVPMITSIITVVINVVLDFVLVNTKLDYMGLALATSIAITCNAIMLFICLEHKFGSLKKRRIFLTIFKSLLSLVLSVVCARGIIHHMYSLANGTLINLCVLLLAMVVAGLIYLGISYLLKMDETHFVVSELLKLKKQKHNKEN